MPATVVADHEEAKLACLKLFRLLRPQETGKNLERLCQLRPDLADDFRAIVDVPSKVISAPEAENGREFLTFEMFSQNGYFRCPWNGKFYNEKGEEHEAMKVVYNQESTQALERSFNEALKTYVHLYYGSEGLSSAFVDDDSGNLTFAALIKKQAEANEEDPCTSTWDSVHVIEVVPVEGSQEAGEDEFTYYHTATVMLSFDATGHNLAGNLMRQNEVKAAIKGNLMQHVITIGKMIEESEGRLRSDLQSVYFGRTHDMVNDLRVALPDGYLRHQADLRADLSSRLNQ